MKFELKQIWGLLRHKRYRLALWAVVTLLVTVVAFHVTVHFVVFPQNLLDAREVASLSFTDAHGTSLRQEMSHGGYRAKWVPLGQISPHLVHATLASEDHRFYDHNGVDWIAMVRAMGLNIKGRRFAFGGSTVTMQLVRLVVGTERTLGGKIYQLFLALNLEKSIGKDAILEQYLNRVYYGNGTWGVGQAARFYFGKSAAELSVGEAALLAVIPRGPGRYNPFSHLDLVMKRRAHILSLMQKRGTITDTARKLAQRTPLSLRREHPGFLAPHFVQYARQQLPTTMQQGAQVRTTLDLPLQRAMERALATHVDKLTWRNLTQAALVVIRNSDGAILSMVGSRNYRDTKNRGAFNGATARLRPGSTLKPFVYGAAFERGDTPATIAYDVVLPEDANQFYTKDVRSHGYARYRESLAGSFNLSAVHTLQRVGIQTVLQKLRDAGLHTLDRSDAEYDWGLAIGHADVRLLDLTAAFSTFGRQGVPTIPRAIERAQTPDGQRWRQEARTGERIFSQEVAYLIFDILSDPDARRPMFGTSVPMNLPFQVALKTGTTKAYTDLWALGTTTEYTVGVWAGNFDGAPTHQVRSVHGATPLMRAAYTAIAARFGNPTAPPKPQAIVMAPICPVSGKTPGPNCQHTKMELFLAGHTPMERCDWHQVICGEAQVVYPPELQGWARELHRAPNRECETAAQEGVQIVSPIEGAQYVLEPHRDPSVQRPPLRAIPPVEIAHWTIDGGPANQWIPHPGTFTATARRGSHEDSVSFTYLE